MTAVLEVDRLNVWLPLPDGSRPLVRDVSFTVDLGEVLGLIGESGSGKTMTATATLNLLPAGLRAGAARLRFAGLDLTTLDTPGFDRLRGTRMAMIFQDPVGALNPAKPISWHFRHVLRRADAGGRHWREAAVALLHDAGVGRAEAVLEQYPHQLSGGMLQRALIALVLALRPSLIVADEPTTNLDSIVGRQIIALFQDVKQRLNASFVYITHDIAIAALFCDRIAVMYAGQIIEQGATGIVLTHPRHPYTQGLIAAATELVQRPHRLREITGEPVGVDLLGACAFSPRCPLAHDKCQDGDPGMRPQADGSSVRCVLHQAAPSNAP